MSIHKEIEIGVMLFREGWKGERRKSFIEKVEI